MSINQALQKMARGEESTWFRSHAAQFAGLQDGYASLRTGSIGDDESSAGDWIACARALNS